MGFPDIVFPINPTMTTDSKAIARSDFMTFSHTKRLPAKRDLNHPHVRLLRRL